MLVVQPTGLSGIWHYANAMAAALGRVGYHVALATQSPYEDPGPLADAAVFTIGPRLRDAPARMPRHARRAANHVEKLARLAALLRRLRPRIVHLHAPLGALDAGYFHAIRALGAKVVYTAHDARPLTREPRWSDWARYRAADRVVVHSRSCARYLTAHGLDPARVAVIPHGNYAALCTDSHLAPAAARRSLGLEETARVALFFGALSLYKGLETLVEAFAEVARRDRDARLVIAGEPLMDVGPLLAAIEALGLGERVSLDLRYIPFAEFGRYFRAADVVVCPHHRISQSGVLLLAYGYGRPVVATDAGGLGEAVLEDETGFVVPAGDAEALAEGILAALADPVRTEAMGRRARLLSDTKYSWTAVGQALAGVYRAVQDG